MPSLQKYNIVKLDTALISAVNLWLANMDAGKLNGSAFIDLKKAFDTVDHNILLRKLCSYGVDGNALEYQAFLTGQRRGDFRWGRGD